MQMMWNAESLWLELEPLLPGLTVEVVAECPSTNTALLERARLECLHDPAGETGPVQVRRSIESGAFGPRRARPSGVAPCLLVAEQQTQGRGRMGRVWTSAKGDSLTFSLSLAMRPKDWSGLSLAVGLALAEALDPEGVPGAVRIGLKWPNDLWLLDPAEAAAPAGSSRGGRKLGGILIETCSAGDLGGRVAVVGVGLNIRSRQERAHELSQGHACVQEWDPLASAPSTLARLALPLVRALSAFEQSGFAPLAERFAGRDALKGRWVTTTQADLPEGRVCGVSARGALQVQVLDGSLREVTSGEVSVRLQETSGPKLQGASC